MSALAGCQAPRTGASLQVSAPYARTASLSLDLSSLRAVRRLAAVEATAKLRVTIQAPDLATPASKDVDLVPPTAAPPMVKDLIPGERRLITVKYVTPEGAELDGLHFRAIADLQPGPNSVALNDLSTVYGDVYAYMLEKFPEAAAAADIYNIQAVVDDTIRSQNAASPRLLDTAAIATVMKDTTGKNLPTPKAEWVARPGYIAVGFLDFPPNVPVRVSVNDATSASVVSLHGEPVMVGPLAPRTAPYQVKITPILPEGATDLVPQTFDVAVSQDRPLSKFPSVFFSKSTPGEALPVRLGPGGGVSVGDALWLLGGLIQPTEDPAGITTAPRVARAASAHRFTRAGKWTTPVPLPDSFPTYGGGVAVDGTKIYVFGGQLDGLGMDKVHVIDTTSTAEAQVLGQPMTLSPSRYPRSATVHLSECAAAKIGSKLYVVGGYTNIANRPDLPLEPFEEMLEYDPASNTFAPEPPVGLTTERARAGMASATIGDTTWVIAGGYQNAEEPVDFVEVFENGNWRQAAPMPTARSYAAAVAVDGKVWVIGGEERKGVASRAVEVYDPATDAWTIHAPLKTARSLPAAGVVKDASGATRIVVAGGVYGVHADQLAVPVPADKVEELAP
jgi:hypothetical protein